MGWKRIRSWQVANHPLGFYQQLWWWYERNSSNDLFGYSSRTRWTFGILFHQCWICEKLYEKSDNNLNKSTKSNKISSWKKKEIVWKYHRLDCRLQKNRKIWGTKCVFLNQYSILTVVMPAMLMPKAKIIMCARGRRKYENT